MQSVTDPREHINDPIETTRAALQGLQSTMWTAMPGVVTSVNLAKMTVACQLAIQGQVLNPDGSISMVDISPVLDLPICFPSTKNFAITFPIDVGDEVLCVFASRCIDSWWSLGPPQTSPPFSRPPAENRMHDLSDGFAIPGPKSLPNVFSSISSTDLQIRNKAGDTFISIGADGLIGFTNAAYSLKKVLSDFQQAMATFVGVLAGFGGGGAPVTQAMLEAPATAAQTSLVAVLAEIEALLK